MPPYRYFNILLNPRGVDEVDLLNIGNLSEIQFVAFEEIFRGVGGTMYIVLLQSVHFFPSFGSSFFPSCSGSGYIFNRLRLLNRLLKSIKNAYFT